MAAGSSAHLVSGVCTKTLQSATLTNCLPLRRLAIHSRFASPFSNDFVGTYGCGKYAPFGPDGTQSVGMIVPPPLTMSNGIIYGKRPSGVTDVLNPGGPYPTDPDPKILQDVWFDADDLVPWNWRQVGMFSNFQTSGPPIEKFHMAIPIRRRLKKPTTPNNESYFGRDTWDFVNASAPIYGQNDWIGALHPAHYFWTNVGVSEPFTVVDYYEQSGDSPPALDLNQWRINFCDPMPIRKQDGTIMGHYTGYTAIHYFSLAYVHFSEALQRVCLPNQSSTFTSVFLPENYHISVIPPAVRPKIKTQNQLFQMETSIFMIAETLPGFPQIKSPRIGTMRWWHYADPMVNPWPCNPYFQMYMPHTGQWKFGIRFNHYDNDGHTDILFGLPMLSTFVAA